MQKDKHNTRQSKLVKIAQTMLIASGLAAGSLIATLSGIVASYQLGKAMQHRATENSKRYVESHLEEVIKKQEETLGIKHFGKPAISYECKSWYDIVCAGYYKSNEDTIHLCINHAITPEGNISDALAKYLSEQKPFDVKSALDHELGHFYMDKLNESKGNGNYTFLEEDPDWKGKKLIGEGIATYFERSLNERKDPVAEIAESDKIAIDKILSLYNVYEVGYHVVKPIIDKHGEKAIEYLMANSPSVDGFIDPFGLQLDPNSIGSLKAYQTKALEQLSNGEK